MRFPLASRPNLSYSTGGRRFGASRRGSRLHAACDLIAPDGTEIFAVDNGIVTRGPYPFYRGTFAIEVSHSTFVARYCEISGTAEGIGTGSEVLEGDLIAYVGTMYTSSMLHFEMYTGAAQGRLTQRNNPPYQRRSDLTNPTTSLDQWTIPE